MSTPLSLTDSTLQLRDGRRLGYLEVGKADGSPIFHFHGHGSSRLEIVMIAESAAALGVRLIGLDRPGIGYSDARPGFRMLDWPDDVEEVANQLGIERFAVEGVSGGGPYALACAYKIPQRLTACGLISSMPPISFVRDTSTGWLRAFWWSSERFPGLFRSYTRFATCIVGLDAATIEKYFTQHGARLGVADQKLLSSPEIRMALVQAWAESYRQGVQGLEANLDEAVAEVLPWGFDVKQIAFEKIFLWHGEQDCTVPVASVRLLAQTLPHGTAVFFPCEGHISTVVHHALEFLRVLSI